MSAARNTWMAIATKAGGQLVFVGGEFTEGTLVNLSNQHFRFDFNINSLRVGLGLGASAGYVIVFAFNCTSPHQLDGTAIEDWGCNISTGLKLGAIGKTLANLKLYATIARIGTHMAIGLESAETLRNAAHYVYTGFHDLGALRGAGPTIVAIDTPAGVGAELSLVKIYGTFKLGANQSVMLPRK